MDSADHDVMPPKLTAGRSSPHFLRRRLILPVLALVLAAVAWGCEAQTRYNVLSFFFDGVPNPKEELAAQGGQGTQKELTAIKKKPSNHEHGPYAAKLCDGCHERSTNALIAPINELCFKCHEFRMDKKWVHGPLASGGCRVCHEPHSSPYRFLLVSESESFCLYCHDEQTVAKNMAHAGTEKQCTVCHNAHMSDKKYLLR